MIYPGRLAPLFVGIAERQASSRTALVQASLSRPGRVKPPGRTRSRWRLMPRLVTFWVLPGLMYIKGGKGA